MPEARSRGTVDRDVAELAHHSGLSLAQAATPEARKSAQNVGQAG